MNPSHRDGIRLNETTKHQYKINQSFCFSLLDAPEGLGGAAPIHEELDIFGPMVSNPLPSSNNTQQAQVHTHTHTLWGVHHLIDLIHSLTLTLTTKGITLTPGSRHKEPSFLEFQAPSSSHFIHSAVWIHLHLALLCSSAPDLCSFSSLHVLSRQVKHMLQFRSISHRPPSSTSFNREVLGLPWGVSQLGFLMFAWFISSRLQPTALKYINVWLNKAATRKCSSYCLL